jgi:phosphate transport system substrate-binding protein
MKRQIMAILSIVLVATLVNGFIYFTVTKRVGNNFSDASQRKMIDVSRYLPF